MSVRRTFRLILFLPIAILSLGVPPVAAQDSECDGVDASVDNCPLVWNSGQRDSDDDGLGDACDGGDVDDDGHPNDTDNCILYPNPSQTDIDGDGFGQRCDADFDDPPDGLYSLGTDASWVLAANGKTSADPEWVFGPGSAGYERLDYDGSGIIDGTDIDIFFDDVLPAWSGDLGNAGLPITHDQDGDGLAAFFDNCPDDANPEQDDIDGDGLGDACDSQSDGDCIEDADDNCTLVANLDQLDADLDGFGDVCDCDADQDGDCNPGAPGPTGHDNFDLDGWADPFDLCPAEPGANNVDSDLDGEGDICEGAVYAQDPPGFAPSKFTIVLLPDTQSYRTDDETENYHNGNQAAPKMHADWICQNRVSLNIVLAAHLGDVANNVEDETNLYGRVSDSLRRIEDCGVPYSVVPGNHDQEEGSQTVSQWNFTTYRSIFPEDRWASSPYFLEASPNVPACALFNLCEEVNTAYLIDTKLGFSFLHLALEYRWDVQQALFDDWVLPVIANFPGLPIFATSHALTTLTSGPNGVCIPTDLLAGHPDVFFTAGGHTLPGGECSEEVTLPDHGGVKRIDAFANYQNLAKFPGEEWLRYCTFDVLNDSVLCRSYSPLLKAHKTVETSTSSNSDAEHVNLGLANRFPSPPPWDDDEDGVVNAGDNCPAVANPGQEDADGDGIGDPCDVVCSDGLDNDGDGFTDHPDDVGCRYDVSTNEAPQCNDGIDNDGNGKIDFTGGPLGEPADPNCTYHWDNYEHPSGCGIGFELLPIAYLLPWVRRRGRARARLRSTWGRNGRG